MEQSQEIDKLAAALSALQGATPKIPFNAQVSYKLKTGGTKEFAYADLNQLWITIRPLLAKNELSVIQPLAREADGQAVIITQLMHSSGQWIRTSAHYGAQGSPQDQGSYMTYIKRYSLAAMLGLVAEEDDDGQTGADNETKAKDAKKEAKQAEEVKQGTIKFPYFMGEIQKLDTPEAVKDLYDKFMAQEGLTASLKTAATKAFERHTNLLKPSFPDPEVK